MSTTASPRKRNKKLRRPFARKIMEQAREIAADYQIVIWFEDGEYYGRGVELPMTFDDGRTPDECVTKTREALAATVATMLEDGETPPPPASEEKRSEQINVRVSATERMRLETLAQQRGFRGVADYLRAVALSS